MQSTGDVELREINQAAAHAIAETKSINQEVDLYLKEAAKSLNETSQSIALKVNEIFDKKNHAGAQTKLSTGGKSFVQELKDSALFKETAKPLLQQNQERLFQPVMESINRYIGDAKGHEAYDRLNKVLQTPNIQNAIKANPPVISLTHIMHGINNPEIRSKINLFRNEAKNKIKISQDELLDKHHAAVEVKCSEAIYVMETIGDTYARVIDKVTTVTNESASAFKDTFDFGADKVKTIVQVVPLPVLSALPGAVVDLANIKAKETFVAGTFSAKSVLQANAQQKTQLATALRNKAAKEIGGFQTTFNPDEALRFSEEFMFMDQLSKGTLVDNLERYTLKIHDSNLADETLQAYHSRVKPLAVAQHEKDVESFAVSGPYTKYFPRDSTGNMILSKKDREEAQRALEKDVGMRTWYQWLSTLDSKQLVKNTIWAELAKHDIIIPDEKLYYEIMEKATKEKDKETIADMTKVLVNFELKKARSQKTRTQVSGSLGSLNVDPKTKLQAEAKEIVKTPFGLTSIESKLASAKILTLIKNLINSPSEFQSIRDRLFKEMLEELKNQHTLISHIALDTISNFQQKERLQRELDNVSKNSSEAKRLQYTTDQFDRLLKDSMDTLNKIEFIYNWTIDKNHTTAQNYFNNSYLNNFDNNSKLFDILKETLSLPNEFHELRHELVEKIATEFKLSGTEKNQLQSNLNDLSSGQQELQTVNPDKQAESHLKTLINNKQNEILSQVTVLAQKYLIPVVLPIVPPVQPAVPVGAKAEEVKDKKITPDEYFKKIGTESEKALQNAKKAYQENTAQFKQHKNSIYQSVIETINQYIGNVSGNEAYARLQKVFEIEQIKNAINAKPPILQVTDILHNLRNTEINDKINLYRNEARSKIREMHQELLLKQTEEINTKCREAVFVMQTVLNTHSSVSEKVKDTTAESSQKLKDKSDFVFDKFKTAVQIVPLPVLSALPGSAVDLMNIAMKEKGVASVYDNKSLLQENATMQTELAASLRTKAARENETFKRTFNVEDAVRLSEERVLKEEFLKGTLVTSLNQFSLQTNDNKTGLAEKILDKYDHEYKPLAVAENNRRVAAFQVSAQYERFFPKDSVGKMILDKEGRKAAQKSFEKEATVGAWNQWLSSLDPNTLIQNNIWIELIKNGFIVPNKSFLTEILEKMKKEDNKEAMQDIARNYDQAKTTHSPDFLKVSGTTGTLNTAVKKKLSERAKKAIESPLGLSSVHQSSATLLKLPEVLESLIKAPEEFQELRDQSLEKMRVSLIKEIKSDVARAAVDTIERFQALHAERVNLQIHQLNSPRVGDFKEEKNYEKVTKKYNENITKLETLYQASMEKLKKMTGQNQAAPAVKIAAAKIDQKQQPHPINQAALDVIARVNTHLDQATGHEAYLRLAKALENESKALKSTPPIITITELLHGIQNPEIRYKIANIRDEARLQLEETHQKFISQQNTELETKCSEATFILNTINNTYNKVTEKIADVTSESSANLKLKFDFITDKVKTIATIVELPSLTALPGAGADTANILSKASLIAGTYDNKSTVQENAQKLNETVTKLNMQVNLDKNHNLKGNRENALNKNEEAVLNDALAKGTLVESLEKFNLNDKNKPLSLAEKIKTHYEEKELPLLVKEHQEKLKNYACDKIAGAYKDFFPTNSEGKLILDEESRKEAQMKFERSIAIRAWNEWLSKLEDKKLIGNQMVGNAIWIELARYGFIVPDPELYALVLDKLHSENDKAGIAEVTKNFTSYQMELLQSKKESKYIVVSGRDGYLNQDATKKLKQHAVEALKQSTPSLPPQPKVGTLFQGVHVEVKRDRVATAEKAKKMSEEEKKAPTAASQKKGAVGQPTPPRTHRP